MGRQLVGSCHAAEGPAPLSPGPSAPDLPSHTWEWTNLGDKIGDRVRGNRVIIEVEVVMDMRWADWPLDGGGRGAGWTQESSPSHGRELASSHQCSREERPQPGGRRSGTLWASLYRPVSLCAKEEKEA